MKAMLDATQSAASVGETIAGKYRIERVLGAGGMGVVVLAQHTQLSLKVALKFMHPMLLADPELRARFRGEAERVAQLQSEHVARVLDVGELADGAPYIVMEYAEGSDLARILRERGSLPVTESADYLLQACHGIAEAHSREIVHRDIKPSNLFVARRHDGSTLVKVLDFGISKTLGTGFTSSVQLTKAHTTMGSPSYSAPEQLESASYADQRSDLWALGVTLYELLTGQSPFEGNSQASLVTSIMSRAPIPLRRVRPELPEDLEWIIGRCLEKDPNRRFQRVAEFAERLAIHGTPDGRAAATRISGLPGQGRPETEGMPAVSLPPSVRYAPPSGSSRPRVDPTLAFSQSTPRGISRRRWVLVAIAGFLVLLVGLVVTIITVKATTEPPPLPPPPLIPTAAPLRLPGPPPLRIR